MIKLKKSLLALRTNHLLTDSVLRYKKLNEPYYSIIIK